MGKTASVTLGKGSLGHNNRSFFTENVDPSLTPQNVVFCSQTLQAAYRELFGAALEDYNQKQKRSDRKIPDYLEHIRQSGNGEKQFHELVIQVGDCHDTGLHTADAGRAKEILTAYYNTFLERNPNMRVFNAVIHMDEPDGTPHLHLDFIPTAAGQKRGLEIKNSMRQALQQLGFDFQPLSVNDNPNISVTYGKAQPKIGGGRWLEAERAALGELLERSGIQWDRRGMHREHLTTNEYKACMEQLERTTAQQQSAMVELRQPTPPMKLAGVKADEVVVRKASLDALQTENVTLRAQAELDKQAVARLDEQRRETDTFVQRAIKTASRESERAEKEAEKVKASFSSGTAEKYQELVGKYNQAVGAYQQIKSGYEAAERRNGQLEASIPSQIENAVNGAVRPLQQENHTLRTELERWRQRAEVLEERVRSLCQTLHDALRALFTLKYNFKDKSPNPYRSDLTDHASQLLAALEQQGRAALTEADSPDLAKGLAGMGVSVELEHEVQSRIMPEKGRNHGLEI